MDYKSPIHLVREFESERDEIIFQMRENFIFVYKNGGTKNYSLGKLSTLAKKEAPNLKWGATTFQHFMEGKLNFSQQDLAPIITLLELSIRLRDKVEPDIQKAKKLIKESTTKWTENDRAPN